MLRSLDRALAVVLLTLALAGGGGVVFLLCHSQVPDWWLPASLAAAVAAAFVPRRAPHAGTAAPRWLLWGGIVVFAVLATMLAYGALATPSRHWDGAAAWDVRARWLTAAPTLEQPFFRDLGVYSHSRDYPLLQPLLLALTERLGLSGRLWFVLAFLVAASAVGLAVWRRTANGAAAWLAALAFAVTPNLVNPTAGGFDSGYADGLLCACLSVAAAGIVASHGAWLLLGTFLCVLCKPEGLPYGAALVASLWLAGNTTLLRCALAGWLGGALLQVPLQRDLLSAGAASGFWVTALVVVAIAAVTLGSDRLLERRGATTTARLGLGLCAATVALIFAIVLFGAYGDAHSSFGNYLAQPSRLWSGLDKAPTIARGALHHGVLRGAFGLTWVLAAWSWFVLRKGEQDVGTRALTWLLVLLPAIWIAPFLLSPFDDLQHHLRSTLPRVLDHGVGAAWLAIAVAWSRLSGAAPLPTSS